MRILAIETSCDDTGVAIIEAKGGLKKPSFKVLANITSSQVALHAKYGGVFPMMAKREHAKNLIPLLKNMLGEAKLLNSISKSQITNHKQALNYKSQIKKLEKTLEREPELLEQFIEFIPKIKKPKIDAIAVTYGPGLEPTLWVGINFAKALSLAWNIPVVPINHMEGHMFTGILQTAEVRGRDAEKCRNNSLSAISYKLSPIKFPAIALLISGGHTELVLMKDWFKYKIVGETLDDAVGEAFDKVARMLGLPYPGGPQISALAEISRKDAEKHAEGCGKILRKSASSPHNSAFTLPRPMLHSGDLNFSFSGLKTAVLYLIKNLEKEHPNILKYVGMKEHIAREFEDASTEVLVSKTMTAMKKCKAKTLILGGGVSANQKIRQDMKFAVNEKFPDCPIYVPENNMTGDNAIMIAVAGYFRVQNPKTKIKSAGKITADGNLRLSRKSG